MFVEPGVSGLALPRSQLHLRLILGQAIPLLNHPGELFAMPGDDGEVVVSQLAPLLLRFAGDLLPIALDLVPVHFDFLRG